MKSAVDATQFDGTGNLYLRLTTPTYMDCVGGPSTG